MYCVAYYGVCLPCMSGFSTQLRILICWREFSFELLIGLLIADGIHPYIVGVSPQMIV